MSNIFISLDGKKYITVNEAASRLKIRNKDGSVRVGSTRRNIEKHIEHGNLSAVRAPFLLIPLTEFERFNRLNRHVGRKRKAKRKSDVVWLGKKENESGLHSTGT